MKKVYEAPEFLSEDVLDEIADSSDNTYSDADTQYDDNDDPSSTFSLMS